jgi:hypothetical protein
MAIDTGRRQFVFALGGAAAAWPLAARAEQLSYPERPLTMVVTFSAGGSSDVLARAVADAMSRGLGRQVAVDNRPGAGGHVGAESVAHAAPDGYTILFGTNGTLGIGPALYKNLRYDPARDLSPVGILHKLPLLLIVNPAVPAQNLRELIDYARDNPGKLSFASAGVGTVSHLAGELFKYEAKIDILHVPYRGGGATFPDLIAGRRPTFRHWLNRGCPISTSAPGRVCSFPPAHHAVSSSGSMPKPCELPATRTTWHSLSRWEPTWRARARKNLVNSCAMTWRAGARSSSAPPSRRSIEAAIRRKE